ncbi:hypothetical protein SLEP1_g58832, partial [Rubroshorea leprosula]
CLQINSLGNECSGFIRAISPSTAGFASKPVEGSKQETKPS